MPQQNSSSSAREKVLWVSSGARVEQLSAEPAPRRRAGVETPSGLLRVARLSTEVLPAVWVPNSSWIRTVLWKVLTGFCFRLFV